MLELSGFASTIFSVQPAGRGSEGVTGFVSRFPPMSRSPIGFLLRNFRLESSYSGRANIHSVDKRGVFANDNLGCTSYEALRRRIRCDSHPVSGENKHRV